MPNKVGKEIVVVGTYRFVYWFVDLGLLIRFFASISVICSTVLHTEHLYYFLYYLYLYYLYYCLFCLYCFCYLYYCLYHLYDLYCYTTKTVFVCTDSALLIHMNDLSPQLATILMMVRWTTVKPSRRTCSPPLQEVTQPAVVRMPVTTSMTGDKQLDIAWDVYCVDCKLALAFTWGAKSFRCPKWWTIMLCCNKIFIQTASYNVVYIESCIL